ncbi:MAG: hypothetical protein HYY17_02580 [Planctomycetes bacterium]|nr:hypothetical protein [Planctomycetota bacterium]
MADFQDFEESDLAFNEDRSLAANAWVARTRASGGEYETWYEWAVWDAETGERLVDGNCDFTTGMWGRSGRELEGIEFVGPRTVVVRTSDGEERVEVPEPKGRVERGENLVRLSFWGNRLGPDLTAEIASSPRLRRVTELDLRGNAIGRKGAEALAAPRRLRWLEALAIADSDVDAEALGTLRARFGDRLQVTSDAPRRAEGARPYFTGDEYRRALGRVSESLKASGHDVALVHAGEAGAAISAALKGGGSPPTLVVYLPGAPLVPRDPFRTFEIEPAIAGQGSEVSVEGLYLRCRRPLADRGRAVLAQAQEALLLERG